MDKTHWLTAKDVAAYLNIATRTVWRMVDRGQLVPMRLSRKLIRFNREDIEELGIPPDGVVAKAGPYVPRPAAG